MRYSGKKGQNVAKTRGVKPPLLRPDLTRIWEAWEELRPDRDYAGMGGVSQPIPYLVIDRYADRNGYQTREDFNWLKHLVRAMDATYLEWCEKQKPKKDNDGK